MLHDDVQGTYDTFTYAQEASLFPGISYSERDRLGCTLESMQVINPGAGFPSTGTFPAPDLYPSV